MNTRYTAAVLVLIASLAVTPVAQAVMSRAGNAEDLGVGLALGQPMGPTVKYWLSSTTAIDGFAGYHFNSNFDVHADYLWHTFSSFDVTSGRLPFYGGLGARINLGNSSDFGARFPLGVSYLFPTDPIELFAEISPVVKLLSHIGLDMDGQMGIRIYLNYLK
jgi:hypothetical protein